MCEEKTEKTCGKEFSALCVQPGFLTVVPVKVTGGDCQEMLKLELLVGVKLVDAELAELLLLDGMDTGAVA